LSKAKVLMSNPPWWEGKEGWLFRRRWRAGVRAGSRWPFTQRSLSRPDHWRRLDYLPYPFFMGYAASYVAKHAAVDVTLRDSIALRESYDRYYRHLAEEKYDYVFIESATPSWPNDLQTIERIQELLPDAKIVICGPICATRAEEILEQLGIHACIKGEYEKGSVRVLNGEAGVIEFDLLTLEEMNSAPYPSYDPICAHRYWDGFPVGQRFPHAQVWSSRGCPFKCIFCVWPATMTGRLHGGFHARPRRAVQVQMHLL